MKMSTGEKVTTDKLEKIKMEDAKDDSVLTLDSLGYTEDVLNPKGGTKYSKIADLVGKSLIVHDFQIEMKSFGKQPERETLVMDFETEGSGDPKVLTTAAWKLVGFAKYHIQRTDLTKKYPFRISIEREIQGSNVCYNFARVEK